MTNPNTKAATEATRWLQSVVQSHNPEVRNERDEANRREAETPFLYGQEFDIEPEVWDLEADPENPLDLL
jgi:hypothetical protein